MNLSTPLSSLVPSLDSAVLEVLVGTHSGVSATQIARLARRGTRAGQRPVLERLVDHGLVLAERSNTGYLYRLNREHVLTPSVLAAVDARHTVVSRLRDACSRLAPAPVHASVFGSFARDQGGADSDIDLLVVVADTVDVHDDGWAEQVERLRDVVLAWTGNRLETVTLTEGTLRRAAAGDEPFVATWRQHALTLVGPEPVNLLTTLVASRG